jgi:uncharacterized iron-regulated membrane protein
MRIAWRKIHRWLGLLVGFQVVAWMLSGLYFAWIPIEEIRGEHLTRPAEPLSAEDVSAAAEAGVLGDIAGTVSPDTVIKKLELGKLRGELVYRLEFSGEVQSGARLYAAQTGQLLSRMEPAEARLVALAALREPADIESVELVTEHSEGSEFRGRSLPLYRVSFSTDNQLRLYLDAWTGEIVARRTAQWRLFDLLWALHIMDYGERDDFNHPLLVGFAAAALALSLGGYILWWISSIWVRKRKVRDTVTR